MSQHRVESGGTALYLFYWILLKTVLALSQLYCIASPPEIALLLIQSILQTKIGEKLSQPKQCLEDYASNNGGIN